MKNVTPSFLKQSSLVLLAWGVALFGAILFSAFLHEVGHGVGARLDGVHISTGFNKVGNPNRVPGDPDFRTGMAEGFWAGLLGPVITWTLTILFTVTLHRLKKPTATAMIFSSLAVVNGMVRAVPMLMFFSSALGGVLHVEDEVSWGIWYVRSVHPELARTDLFTLAESQSGLLLQQPAVWISPLASFAVSAVCLFLAYRWAFRLWHGVLKRGIERWVFGLMPLPIWFASIPVLDVLDRVIRINW